MKEIQKRKREELNSAAPAVREIYGELNQSVAVNSPPLSKKLKMIQEKNENQPAGVRVFLLSNYNLVLQTSPMSIGQYGMSTQEPSQ